MYPVRLEYAQFLFLQTKQESVIHITGKKNSQELLPPGTSETLGTMPRRSLSLVSFSQTCFPEWCFLRKVPAEIMAKS